MSSVKEINWIACLKENGEPVLNVMRGGEGGATYGRLGKPWTEEHRKNYSASRLGVSIKQRDPKGLRAKGIKRAWDAGRATGMTGKKHKPTTIEKMSRSQLARIERSPNLSPANLYYYRSITHYERQGKSQTLLEWSQELGISRETLSTRLHRGWSVERALSTAVRKKKIKRK